MTMTAEKEKLTLEQESLIYHAQYPSGKISITTTKELNTQKDLSLAYSPGVAQPCLEIKRDPELAYKYTAKGNLVCIISNGTAVLGLGNLGALASKPVMEGKAALFKKFSGINALDLEVDTQDPQEFINCVKLLGPSFGGINLEDIKAPECFIIEDELKKVMNIPILHDDQHGTATIVLAGLINAAKLVSKKLEEIKITVIGAGAAAIACMDLLIVFGVPKTNIILCDTRGVIYEGRTDGMNPWKEKYAAKTEKRSISDAVAGADAVIGLSAKGMLSKEMIESMNAQPIVFALANPNPEILPEEVKSVRPDAIVATGRSDKPNQINNVMGFPYIFRGTLDTRSTIINKEMLIAAALSLAALAREAVPQEVLDIYPGQNLEFGLDYIVPKPFDPRLLYAVSSEVARAAMKTGVAKNPITDFDAYKSRLEAGLF
jgi:malate dehydrogenase (oxaloacetate-decarboxylating)(NADP+)